MNTILTLVRKDLAMLRRDKAALVLTFAVPFALIFVFGQIFVPKPGNSSGPTGVPLAVVNASDNPAAVKLVDALKAEKAFSVITTYNNPDKTTRPLAEADLEPLMRANAFRFAVVIPADLVRTDEIGLHQKILSNPRNEIETQMVNGILQKTIFSNVPQLLGQSLQARAKQFVGNDRLNQFNGSIASSIARTFGGDPAVIQRDIESGSFGLDRALGGGKDAGTSAGGGSGGADFFSKIVKIDSVQVVGKEVKSPMATRSVGGWAMQFLLFALTASANSLFYEKEQGLLQRLLSTPTSRADILWSKFIYGVILGLVQLVVLFLAGRFLYGIDVEHHLPLLILVCLFAAAACTAFGMLLAAISPSPEAARGIGTLVILLMSAIGGAWFPTSLMPEFLQSISKLTLVYWAMEGFQQVLWANASFVEVLPTVGFLALIAAVVMAVAVWRFNRGRLFA
ncbi:MAG TPA: ABC transporter permease [Candidatus Didemnitutus sp.]|nr:ABC transporter permease [Candidatus Didemnitutus sp.]